MKRKSTFNKLLNMHCKARGMKRYELSKILDITPTHLSNLGSRYGITIHMLDKIIKLLKIKGNDEVALRNAAIYTNPKQILVVDKKLFSKLEYQADTNPDSRLFDEKEYLVLAALKFVGVKFKIGEM